MNPTTGGNGMESLNSPGSGWRARLRGRVSARALMAAGLLAVSTVAFVSGGMYFSEARELAPPKALSQTTPAPSPKLLSESHQFSFADLVERVAPAVVTVQVDIQSRAQNLAQPEIPAPFRDF